MLRTSPAQVKDVTLNQNIACLVYVSFEAADSREISITSSSMTDLFLLNRDAELSLEISPHYNLCCI